MFSPLGLGFYCLDVYYTFYLTDTLQNKFKLYIVRGNLKKR